MRRNERTEEDVLILGRQWKLVDKKGKHENFEGENEGKIIFLID